MNHPAVVGLVLKLLVGCYSYMLLMASANVLSCEIRRPGQCGNQWTQAFTVAGGASSTLWAYITESPNHSNQPPSDRGRSRNPFGGPTT
jgi:hypothetical protein